MDPRGNERTAENGRDAAGPPPMEEADREKALRLQLLAEVGRKTTAILSFEELLRSAVHVIRETFSYFMVNIFLVEGEDLVPRACTMPELQKILNRIRLRIGRDGITGWVAGHCEPLNVPDVRRDPRYSHAADEELFVRSELAVPVALKGKVIGVLDAQSEQVGAFTELDVFTLSTVADQLAVAIENARLYEELQKELAVRRRTETLLRALHGAGLAMEMSSSPEAVFVTMGEELRKMGLLCTLHLASEDRRLVSLAYASPDLALETTPTSHSPLADNRVFEAIASGASAVFESGAVVAPLLFEDRLLGFLSVYSLAIGMDDIPTIQVFANEIAAAWSKAHLVRELRKSLRELERTQELLVQSQKMEAVGRLAGGVAHDFNNQLTAILGYADLLLSSFNEVDPRRAELLEIRRAAGRAADLTRQLLAFSRRQVLQLRVVDLRDLVGEMRGMLQRLIGENIRLETRYAEGPLRVKADPAQLEQVVMNLAVNARDAMPDGGTLEIIADRTVVGEGPRADSYRMDPGAYCILRVTDTGTGMAPEVLSRLYEPFFTTKERGKGTGLGLSTAYGIVRQSGGHIDCRSAPGQGSTFLIHLPATDELPESVETAAAAPAPAAGTETILVIEDDEQVRQLVRRTLTGVGYRVLTAATGEEGMEVFRGQSGIQLVITDLVLPGKVSGIEVARQVRLQGQGVRLICISGYSDQLQSDPAATFPRDSFLPKPFSASDLLHKTRSVLDQSP